MGDWWCWGVVCCFVEDSDVDYVDVVGVVGVCCVVVVRVGEYELGDFV